MSGPLPKPKGRKAKPAKPMTQAEATSVLAVLSAQVAGVKEVSESPRPHVLVSLDHAGALQMELPGAGGGTRVVPLKPGKEAETLERVLQAQLVAQAEQRRSLIGLDGAPTQAQAKHWQEHQDFPRDTCPFCRAEGRTQAGKGRRRRIEATRGDGSVRVRTLPPRRKSRVLSERVADLLGI